ncbi:MAG: hypothetical protein KQH57_17685 [Actinomycetales bacterium]|nr:hypothetical protein [Actinomycetales bacterium]
MITRLAPHYGDPTCASIVTAGGFAFLSHHAGNLSDTSYAAQTRGALDAMRETLARVGTDLTSLVQVTMLVRELTDEIRAAWDVFDEYFGDQPPARATVTTDFFDAACLVQLDGIAHLGDERG